MVPVIYFLWMERFEIALILFIVAGLSDALDGFLAKKFDWTSQLGSFLDPLADKLLLVSCFLVCVFIELIPLWLFVLILVRDLVVAFGALFYHFMIEEFHGEPPFSSKLNTAFQIIYLVMLLAGQSVINVPIDWVGIALYSVAATTIISGLEYIWVWGFKAWEARFKGQYEKR